jgi:hypothetical protein
MGLFAFKLERADGTPADPPTFKTAVPTWQRGDTIPLGKDRTLQVIGTRAGRDAGRRSRPDCRRGNLNGTVPNWASPEQPRSSVASLKGWHLCGIGFQ